MPSPQPTCPTSRRWLSYRHARRRRDAGVPLLLARAGRESLRVLMRRREGSRCAGRADRRRNRTAESRGLTVLTEWESKQRLRRPPPFRSVGPDRWPKPRAVAELRAPLVAKASGVAHKSERGLVRLDLSPEEVLNAWQELAGAGDGTVIVAEFIRGELELVVGGLRDPHFGPAVTMLGGTAAEIFNDTATILAPPEPGVESAEGAQRCSAAPRLPGRQLPRPRRARGNRPSRGRAPSLSSTRSSRSTATP